MYLWYPRGEPFKHGTGIAMLLDIDSMERMIRMNLENVFLQANKMEILQGKQWYSGANAYLNQIAEHFDMRIEKVCGIASALSPACQWKRNVVDAYQFIKTKGKWKCTTYYGQKEKARKILRLKDRDLHKIPEILHGPKTREFYLALLNPSGNNLSVIDTHMVKAYLNLVGNTSEIKRICKRELTEKNMAYIQNDIIGIARRYKLHVNECQAVIWSVWKRVTNNKIESNSLPIFEYLTMAPKDQTEFSFAA